DRLRVMASGTELRFYLNYASPGASPAFYVSPMAVELPISVDVFVGVDVLSGIPPEMRAALVFSGARSTVYSAAQKAEDGIATSDPLYMNIYQMDSRVGRGYPAKVSL